MGKLMVVLLLIVVVVLLLVVAKCANMERRGCRRYRTEGVRQERGAIGVCDCFF